MTSWSIYSWGNGLGEVTHCSGVGWALGGEKIALYIFLALYILFISIIIIFLFLYCSAELSLSQLMSFAFFSWFSSTSFRGEGGASEPCGSLCWLGLRHNNHKHTDERIQWYLRRLAKRKVGKTRTLDVIIQVEITQKNLAMVFLWRNHPAQKNFMIIYDIFMKKSSCAKENKFCAG